MTRDELNVALAAVLDTLAEFPEGALASTIYMALGHDMSKWELVRNVLVSARLVKITSHLVTITAEGMKIVAKMRAATA